MSMKQVCESKYVKTTMIIILVLFVALVSFGGGVVVGLHKARFSYAFGENYERNFGRGPRGPMMRGEGREGAMGMFGFMDRFENRDFRNAHGMAGTVLSISDSSLIVKDRDDKENAVTVTDKTLIKSGRDTITETDLKTGDRVVVVGKPGENGVVNADLIRVFDRESDNE